MVTSKAGDGKDDGASLVDGQDPAQLEASGSVDADTHDSKDGDTTSSDSDSPPRRVTRGQNRQPVDGSSPDSDGVKTRRASKSERKTSPSSQPKTSKKANSKRTSKPKQKDGESDDSDSTADYVHVQVGDCVMLDSGDPEDPYVALVSSVQTSQRHDRQVSTFMAQWYYKPYDLREEVKDLVKGGILDNEVFLSPHKDRNSIDAVIEVCQVVSPEEYKEIQDEIRRGYREKGKTYFVCRFKYYPNRSNAKKALEAVENEAIRSGLGRPKPNVGESYQAKIPAFVEPATRTSDVDGTAIPWKVHSDPVARPRQMWSPLVTKTHTETFVRFRGLVDTLKFAVGNVVKTYRPDAKPMGHQRGIILEYTASDSIQVCVSSGQVLTVLKSELCSPLSDDLAMQHLYLSRFNLSLAAFGCSKTILHAQHKERKAFRREVKLFAEAHEKTKAATATQAEPLQASVDSTRKRKK